MILITTYYKPKNKDREQEINRCLLKNYQNKYIEKIYLLNDKIYDIPIKNDYQKKIEQVIVSNNENYKLTYYDSIKFINEKLINRICILSNSDIYFNNSLSKINNDNINNNFIALLRYDEDKDYRKNIFKRYDEVRDDSQDCWIFKSPLNININNLTFSFGTLGCDSIFASYVANESGLNIINPCYDIITTHVHNTEYRTYSLDDRIHGNYCLIKPCYLGEKKSISFIKF
jgi:hypothetical protein